MSRNGNDNGRHVTSDDEIIGEGEASLSWVPVAEELPDDGESVLIATWRQERDETRRVFEATHKKNGEFQREGVGFPITADRIEAPIFYRVTHWMPVPKPPEMLGEYPEPQGSSDRPTKAIEERTSDLG